LANERKTTRLRAQRAAKLAEEKLTALQHLEMPISEHEALKNCLLVYAV